MESKAKYYKSGNYIITVLFVVLLGMVLYCAKVIEQDRVIYFLSMLCVGAWGCISYNNIKKEKVEKTDTKVSIVVTKDEDKKVIDSNVPDYILEEENYRVAMLNKALESTLMVVNNEEKSIGTGIIINENGTVLISNCNYSSGEDAVYYSVGDEVLFRRYVSDKIIKGHVVKVIEDGEGNKFSLVELNIDNYTAHFTIGNSDDVNIGTKVYGLAAFNVNNSINVIEGVISQLNQLNRVDINGVEVFKNSNCLLYNGVSTEESIGGPLINSNGELIGVLLGRTKHYDRLNFALPINELIENLEVQVTELTDELEGNATTEKDGVLEDLTGEKQLEFYKGIEDMPNAVDEEVTPGIEYEIDDNVSQDLASSDINESAEENNECEKITDLNSEIVEENIPKPDLEVFDPKDDEVGDETRDN